MAARGQDEDDALPRRHRAVAVDHPNAVERPTRFGLGHDRLERALGADVDLVDVERQRGRREQAVFHGPGGQGFDALQPHHNQP